MNYKNSKRLVLAALNDGTYDPAEGCRWPRDVIAAYTGLSEKTVSRATAELEAEEQLRVIRPRRRGECNTYFVAVWNPPLRKRTVARLKSTKPTVFRLRESKCPPNRTAGPKGSDQRGKDNSLNVVDQRGWSRERGLSKPTFRFERSRSVPEPARALRVVGCPQCEKYRRMVDALEVDLQNAEASLRAERRQKNEAKAETRRLRNTRENEAKETPNIELIQRLWEFHRQHVRPRNRKLDLKTIEAVRARLLDTLPESDEPAYSPRYIAEAILGAKYEAFVDGRGKRHDQLELICRDSKHLEDFHERYERCAERRFARAEA